MRAIVAILAAALVCPAAFAQEVSITASDTAQSVLAAQKGKRVTVRLRSGQELTGLVREANGRLAVIGALTGRELFDAVVPLEAIEAVLIRTRQQ
jgi:hypothetical protein